MLTGFQEHFLTDFVPLAQEKPQQKLPRIARYTLIDGRKDVQLSDGVRWPNSFGRIWSSFKPDELKAHNNILPGREDGFKEQGFTSEVCS